MALKMYSKENRNPTLKVLGYISTGITVPNKKGEGKHGEQVDHFVLPDPLIEFFESKGLPTEPKALDDVYLIADDPDKAFNVQYRRWGSYNALLCYGDDVTGKATQTTFDDENKPVKQAIECKGEECKHRKPNEQGQCACTPKGTLYIIIPDYPEFGVWAVQCGGSSIFSILNGIDSFLDTTSLNRLRGVPMKLEVISFQSTGGGRRTTKYKITITCARSFREVLALARAEGEAVGALPPASDLGIELDEPIVEPVLAVDEPEHDETPHTNRDALPIEAEYSDDKELPEKSEGMDDPFAVDPDVAYNEMESKITKAEAKTLDDMQQNLLTDEQWLSALKFHAKVDKTKDIPKLITNKKGEQIKAFEFFRKQLEDARKRLRGTKSDAPAAEAETATCMGCQETFPKANMKQTDEGMICAECASFASGLAA